MTRTINIGGTDVAFKASGATPRIYRNKFHRDLLKDIGLLTTDKKVMDLESLEVFENLAYTMAFQAAAEAGEKIQEDPDLWLDQFDMFSIYEVLPQLIELWNLNTEPLVESKKK